MGRTELPNNRMQLTAPLVDRAKVREAWARRPRAHSRAGAAADRGVLRTLACCAVEKSGPPQNARVSPS
jgi:hypothetical protein